MSGWYFDCEAIDPRNDKVDIHIKWSTGVFEKHFKKLQTAGHDIAISRLILMREVLDTGTNHIYKGWSRPSTDDSYVYVG